MIAWRTSEWVDQRGQILHFALVRSQQPDGASAWCISSEPLPIP